MTPKAFNVYGYRFSVEGSAEASVAGVCQDFAHFATEPTGEEITISVLDAAPDYDRLPELEATVYSPRNVVYKRDGTAYIDYQGQGLGVHHVSNGRFEMHSKNSDLAYEAVYLFLLSRIGEYLDGKGLHRVHALAVSVHGRAALVLLPSGGGKSTLATALLQFPEVKLLSDDSPLIDRAGQVWAFPLRLGLLPGNEQDVEPHHYRTITRMEAGPKHLLNHDYFAHRVVADAKAGILLVGVRTLAQHGETRPVGKWHGLRAMFANCVVGLGLFQGVEFILSSSPWELLGKAGLGLSRSWNSIVMLRRSKVYRLALGRSSSSNARLVVELLIALDGQTSARDKEHPEPTNRR